MPSRELTAWALSHGLPAQVVGLLHRAGVLEHVDYTGKELVRMCEAPEGRARLLSHAEIREALRQPQGDEGNVWTTRDMIEFMRTGALPAWLEREYKLLLRLDEEFARPTRIDRHRIERPDRATSPRAARPRHAARSCHSPLAQSPLRSRTGSAVLPLHDRLTTNT